MLKPAFIDLSHHNVIPDNLEPAKEFGILGVIHKLTEATGFVDSKCDNRFYMAQQVNMLWGLYHFIRPGRIKEQAEFFCEHAYGVSDGNTLYCLDYEDPGVSADDCIEFLQIVEEMTGHRPVLYSGHVLKEELAGKPNKTLSGYRLWLAQYGSKCDLPPGWSKFWGWQYTDKGKVPGIDPPTDMNAYDGTKDQLYLDWSGSDKSPAPEQVKEIEISVKLKTDPPDAKVEILSVTIV